MSKKLYLIEYEHALSKHSIIISALNEHSAINKFNKKFNDFMLKMISLQEYKLGVKNEFITKECENG